MKNETMIMLNSVSLLIVCMILLYLLLFPKFTGFEIMTENDKIDDAVEISCKSDSMGLTMNCKDKLLVRYIKYDDKLIEGDIYGFKSPYRENSTVVHRCIYIMNNGTQCVFKGDNNEVADPLVNFTNVYFKVLGVMYK